MFAGIQTDLAITNLTALPRYNELTNLYPVITNLAI